MKTSNVYSISGGKLVPLSRDDLLPVGSLVSYEDRANPRRKAVVTGADCGEYGYGQKCVWEGGHASTVHASDPDKYGMSSGPWHFVRDEWARPIVLDAEGIAAFLRLAEATRVRKEMEAKVAAQAKADAQDEERQRILAEFSYLETKAGSKKSDHALAASNLRKLLKRQFPGATFSVKSDSYSGGDSVNVSWIDGPKSDEVDAVADRFQECDFDVSDDSTHYRKTVWPKVFGGAKYVTCQRRISDAMHVAVALELGYTVTPGNFGAIVGCDYETTELIYREARNRSY